MNITIFLKRQKKPFVFCTHSTILLPLKSLFDHPAVAVIVRLNKCEKLTLRHALSLKKHTQCDLRFTSNFKAYYIYVKWVMTETKSTTNPLILSSC